MGIICFDNKKNYQNIEVKTNVIWIDPNIDNQENINYLKKLSSNNSLMITKFKNIEEAINHFKGIKFRETKVIISGRFYKEFINSFKKNMKSMFVSPKIIVFTGNKTKFIEKEKDYQNNENIFYIYGGITDNFKKVKEFIKEEKNEISENDNQMKQSNWLNEIQLTFEYIDSKEKLVLPLFFKALIDITEIDNIEAYTQLLYKTYSNENFNVKILLGQIESMKNIPIEILSKYYARLYTLNSNFYRYMNKDLGLNKKEFYLP